MKFIQERNNETKVRVEPKLSDQSRMIWKISSKGAVLPAHNDAEMGLINSLHASVHYSKYNERFDLKY